MPTVASEDNPIRASMLPLLFKCPRSFMAKMQSDGDDGGDAAQTGSLAHLGFAEWERTHSESKATKSLQIAMTAKQYPLADNADAMKMLEQYIKKDKSGTGSKGVTKYVEQKIKIILEPVAEDKTQEKIVIFGTIDLVKELTDCYHVIDHKTGRVYGDKMIQNYPAQIAAYVYGASTFFKLNKPVKGYITRTRDLVRSNLPYMWDTGIDVDRAKQILDVVRHRIAILRNGQVCATPGDHCDWCNLDAYPSCMDGTLRGTSLPVIRFTKPLGDLSSLLKGFK